MIIKGSALKVERVKGERDGRTWDYVRVSVWDGSEYMECRVGDEWPADRPIVPGAEISALVNVKAFMRGREASLSVTLVAPYDEGQARRAG